MMFVWQLSTKFRSLFSQNQSKSQKTMKIQVMRVQRKLQFSQEQMLERRGRGKEKQWTMRSTAIWPLPPSLELVVLLLGMLLLLILLRPPLAEEVNIIGDVACDVIEAGNASEPSDSEIVVEEILTSRGRRAKRISYAKLSGGVRETGSTKCKNNSPQKKNISESNDAIKTEQLNVEPDCDKMLECLQDTVEDTEKISQEKTADLLESICNTEEYVSNECSENANEDRKIKIKLQGVKAQMIRKGRSAYYVCKVCNFRTSHKNFLKMHMRKHTGEKPYGCPECGKAFPQSSSLNVHMKRHRGQRDFPCEYCDYKAYTKIDKLRHETIHTGERNQICEYCGKAFAKDSTLREHVKSIHERSVVHECEECGFRTYRANNLKVHRRMKHHGEYNNHICPVCGARVKQKTAFLEHMRRHTGERPYKCDQCDSSFACMGRLTVHKKSVHNPRQFPCSQCNKVFQTKHHLYRHEIIHTKEKPFSCFLCTYSCNTQGNLTKHVKSIHHKMDFSYRKMKAEKESNLQKGVEPEWVQKGQKVTEQYLKELSSKMGENLTIDDLKEKEKQKQDRLEEEIQKATVKRLTRTQVPEHSYHSKSKSTTEDFPEHSYYTKLVGMPDNALYAKLKLDGNDNIPKEIIQSVHQSDIDSVKVLTGDATKIIQIQTSLLNDDRFIISETEGVHSVPDNEKVHWFVHTDDGLELVDEIRMESNRETLEINRTTSEITSVEDKEIEIQGYIGEDGLIVPFKDNAESGQPTLVVIINPDEHAIA